MASPSNTENEIQREMRISMVVDQENAIQFHRQLQEACVDQERMRLEGDYKKFLQIWKGHGKGKERSEWLKQAHEVRG